MKCTSLLTVVLASAVTTMVAAANQQQPTFVYHNTPEEYQPLVKTIGQKIAQQQLELLSVEHQTKYITVTVTQRAARRRRDQERLVVQEGCQWRFLRLVSLFNELRAMPVRSLSLLPAVGTTQSGSTLPPSSLPGVDTLKSRFSPLPSILDQDKACHRRFKANLRLIDAGRHHQAEQYSIELDCRSKQQPCVIRTQLPTIFMVHSKVSFNQKVRDAVDGRMRKQPTWLQSRVRSYNVTAVHPNGLLDIEAGGDQLHNIRPQELQIASELPTKQVVRSASELPIKKVVQSFVANNVRPTISTWRRHTY